MLESAQRQKKVNAVTSRQSQARTQCRGCGARPHPKSECPAQGKTCNLCGRPNHYASVCESADKPVVFGNTGKRSTRGRGHGKPRNAHSGRPSRGNFHNAPPYAAPAGRGGDNANQVMLGHETDQSTVDPFSNIPWNTIFQVGTNANLPYTSLSLDNNPVRIMVDTGCSLNIIDEATYRRMRPLPGLKPNPVPVHTYNNSNRLNILGEFSAKQHIGDDNRCSRPRWLLTWIRNSCQARHSAVDLHHDHCPHDQYLSKKLFFEKSPIPQFSQTSLYICMQMQVNLKFIIKQIFLYNFTL